MYFLHKIAVPPNRQCYPVENLIFAFKLFHNSNEW